MHSDPINQKIGERNLSVLLDPRLFNFLIMGLYGFAVVRWLFAANLWAAGYWSCALGLTIIITFGRTH